MQQFDYNKYLKNNPLLKESFMGSNTDVYEEAQNILDDILSERDWMEIADMTIEDALDTVEAYGHSGPKAQAIAEKLVALVLGDGTPTRQMTGDADADFMGEAVSTDFAKAALELVTLAKNLISRAGESLIMNSEVKKASMITDADGMSKLYYHLQDVLGELIGSEARVFTREAKKIIVDKYGITMTDEYGFPMKWVKEGINESTKTIQTLKSTKPGASPEKVAIYILKQLKKNYTDEEIQDMSMQDAIDTVESYGFEGPEVEEIVDMIYMML